MKATATFVTLAVALAGCGSDYADEEKNQERLVRSIMDGDAVQAVDCSRSDSI
jgi:hypothetical protein